jgi:FtsP/CotA-like multicopper oxidase with cupredoxin domain
MAKQGILSDKISRRDFLRLGGGVLVATAGAGLLAGRAKALLRPESIRPSTLGAAGAQAGVNDVQANYILTGTDGWVHMPPTPAIPPYHPDPFAPDPFTTYVFGLSDVTGLTQQQITAQKGHVQVTAPLLIADEGQDFILQLSNLGMAVRPDLFDSHTIHWHGFPNQIPYFDGEPMGSVAVPPGLDRTMTYFYRPRDPGTYMYHCHVEDTEHIQMGMTGSLFVRPAQNQGAGNIPPGKYVYNDGVLPSDPTSTAYDREFALMFTDFWAEAHWDDAHIQLPDWTDYKADFNLINGRAYPDTLAPNGSGRDPVTGDLIPPPGHPELQYQPISSLIQANAGDRVLLRMASLAFKLTSMTLPGIPLRVVGKDASFLRGTDGTNLQYTTNTILLGAGESYDVIFIAPPVTTLTTFLFYDRNYERLNNAGGTGYGGRMTEVRVYPAGTLPPQTAPNT